MSPFGDMPLVSVIIPTFNRGEDLRRAVASVLCQTRPEFEILIMDDGSTDGTPAVVQQFADSRIKYEWAKNSGGPATPRNRGLRLARGKYVAFLDADDWWSPEKLAESLKHLEAGADVVYHDLYRVSRPRQRLFLRRAHTRALTVPAFTDLIKNGNALNNSSVVLRKGLLDSIGGQSEDPGLVAAEDYDAWLQIARRTEKFPRIPQTLGYYWAGGGNISNPHRMLRYIELIELRHGPAFAESTGGGCPCWLHYGRGRSQYLLGSYKLARESLERVRLSEASLAIRFKTRWMLTLIRLLHRPSLAP